MTKEHRKIRVGRVIKSTTDKTILVATKWEQRHLIYKKAQRKIAKFYVHDTKNEGRVGDLVRIEETRPISKMKRWRLLSIIKRDEVASTTPMQLDEDMVATANVVDPPKESKAGEEDAPQNSVEQEVPAEESQAGEEDAPEDSKK